MTSDRFFRLTGQVMFAAGAFAIIAGLIRLGAWLLFGGECHDLTQPHAMSSPLRTIPRRPFSLRSTPLKACMRA